MYERKLDTAFMVSIEMLWSLPQPEIATITKMATNAEIAITPIDLMIFGDRIFSP
jgi:hypothetical protein